MNIFQVDAFSNKLFKGNPAAVCPLKKWITEDLMQEIAKENNLSETVFFVEKENQFEIKWFTPTCEVDLCGHATLAAAHIIFSELNYLKEVIEFSSKSGILTVKKTEDWYTLNFPSEAIEEIDIPFLLKEALNTTILKTHLGKWKLLVELTDEESVKNLTPNFSKLAQLNYPGIIVTAKGNKVDFVSRFFAPKMGINEDPVTGSAHTLLIPFWSKKLDKINLEAIQLSNRTGYLKCKHLNNRVEISGQAITFLKGQLTI